MGQEVLVEEKIADSIELMKNLDAQGTQLTNALWLLFSDAESWRLLLAGEAFDPLLPKKESLAYEKVAKAMGGVELKSLSIADIKLVSKDYPLLKATTFIKTSGTGIMRAHFKDTTFNGIFVKEMLVLRAS